jgi:hypothetical protein
MKKTALSLVVLLVGCGTNVDGNWVGDCNIDSGTSTSDTTIDLELVADGKEVSGSGQLIEGGLLSTDVLVDGTLEGKNILLDLQYDLGGSDTGSTGLGGMVEGLFDISYEIDAKVKGDVMEGRCTVRVMGFGVGADIELERQ